MNKPVNGGYFITMEDISTMRESDNIVVYNWNLPEKRRIELFRKYMKQRYPHTFTKSEIDTILSFNHTRSLDLILYIRNIIRN